MIAVGLGPGSYTGIRVAISMAQGWQLARGVKLLGVSSAECLAAQAQAEKIFGRVNVVIDAQRNEFYLATYEISPRGWQGNRAAADCVAGGNANPGRRRRNLDWPGSNPMVSEGKNPVSVGGDTGTACHGTK